MFDAFSISDPSTFHPLLTRALHRRAALIESGQTQALRVFSGAADGMDGVFVDVYASGAVLIVYQGRSPRGFDVAAEAIAALDVLKPIGVCAVYVKEFARDRSRLGGELSPELLNPTPAAGETLPEALLIREAKWTLEVRLYDGLSTGLFLDQRENRVFLSQWASRRAAKGPPAVLNTFAYTCAFSIAAAIGGAITTSVDVSARYLDWGKRNFAHNAIDAQGHRFAKMDTFEFFAYARRKGLRYDLVILDPPSFASGSKRKGIRPWSSVADYARLVKEAAALLNPRGMIFASTNTQELCQSGRLEKEIIKGIGGRAKWIELPNIGVDFAAERERFAARAFEIA
ncbi:MAG TPA: class I SAM-dependent methyltransferase [Tepidisphaeraceae bacterium]|jgi:23S rRNA (cytosine1962-C5)-methyltransferase|nr:class I SAM-dependent methyltransferase [Tepidisphaeraceae bacterium]